MKLKTEDYDIGHFFDEMIDENRGIRSAYETLHNFLSLSEQKDLEARQYFIDKTLFSRGITFNVYENQKGTEKIFPLDPIPRIITAEEWAHIEAGLKQRITALNLFIQDIYNDQAIIKDKIIPRHIIESSSGYLKVCEGITPRKSIWCHISGIDLIRDQDGQFYVLEDNLRCPSGVAYLLENREIMKRAFPSLIEQLQIRPVSDYTSRLLDALQNVSETTYRLPVLLTPGIFNAAYYEHCCLARQMGIELVQPDDLLVKKGALVTRTTRGFEKVDVVYRRIDDLFLDPEVFNKKSLMGVPGLFELFKKGKVGVVNAPGCGVADDKVIYTYVPQIIRYYLSEDPILPNVETYICADKKQKNHVLNNLDKLVLKRSDQAGGHGMLIGPHATPKEQQLFKKKVMADPTQYIAQPMIPFSRAPSFINKRIQSRHVDLRPFAIYGDDIYITPGGLTRVALKKDSLVVNSSQGGGSKDTWVLGK
jgi:uncharacterized circularly permuted ATP-grasp superfamily protein